MRIAKIEAFPILLPLKGMFISSHGSRASTARTVIRLTTEHGVVGYGETFRGAATAHVIDQVAPRLLGRDVFAIDALQEDLHMVPFFFGYIGYAALAGIEMACLDAIGRAKGISLSEWLGGAQRRHIPITGLLTRALGADPASLGEAARGVIAEGGYRTLKIKGSTDADADAALCEGVRRAVGDGVALRVDPNAAWSVPASIRAGRRLEGIAMEWLEDPCAGLEGMAEVRRQVRIPLCTNMCVVRIEEVAPAVRMRAVDVIHADVHKWGGVAPTRRLAAICGAFGLGMSMHSGGEAGISTACHLHVAAAMPEINYAIDSMHEMLADDVVAEGPLPVRDGGFEVPHGPGMGVTVDPDKLRFYAERYEEEDPTG